MIAGKEAVLNYHVMWLGVEVVGIEALDLIPFIGYLKSKSVWRLCCCNLLLMVVLCA